MSNLAEDYYINIEEKNMKRSIFFIFLCGSFYKNSDSNKRKILGNVFLDKSSKTKKYILIIPEKDFSPISNISVKNNIYQAEQITSEISSLIIIFLETFSSAAELGIFSTISRGESGNIVVLYPKNKKVVNYESTFIDKNIISKNNDIVYYDSNIIESSSSHKLSPFKWHLFFKDETLSPIKLFNDPIMKNKINKMEKGDSLNFYFYKNIYKNSNQKNKILFDKKDDIFHVHFPIENYMYLILSIIATPNLKNRIEKETHENGGDLNKAPDVWLSFRGIINEIIRKTFIRYVLAENEVVDDNTVFYNRVRFYGESYNPEVFFDYIFSLLKKNKVINLKNKDGLTAKNKIAVLNSVVIKSEDSNNILEWNKLEVTLKNTRITNWKTIYNIYKRGEIVNHFNTFTIKKKGKIRKIKTYKRTNSVFRKFHLDFVDLINKKYNLKINNSYVYSYKPGVSIVNMLDSHYKQCHYLKFDIKNYFNSINHIRLSNILYYIFDEEIDRKTIVHLLKILSGGEESGLPIGLIPSAILSNIFLSSFDQTIADAFESGFSENIVYTRYADDILVSSDSELSNDKVKFIEEIISKTLHKEFGLSVNTSKSKVKLLSDNENFRIFNILVNKDGDYKIPRKSLDIMFGILINFLKFPSLISAQKVIGKISYYKFINEKQVLEYLIRRIGKTFEDVDEIYKFLLEKVRDNNSN